LGDFRALVGPAGGARTDGGPMSKTLDAYPGRVETRRLVPSDDEEDLTISLVSLEEKKVAAKNAKKAPAASGGAGAKPRSPSARRGSNPASASRPQPAPPRSAAKPVGSPAKAAARRDDRSSSAKKAEAEEQAAVIDEKKRARQGDDAPRAKRRLQSVEEEEKEVQQEEEDAAESVASAQGASARESYKYDQLSGARRPPDFPAADFERVPYNIRFQSCEYRVR